MKKSVILFFAIFLALFFVSCDDNIEEPTVQVDSITLDKDSLTLMVGEAGYQLNATILPEDATDKSITWESSDMEIATVEDGYVTAVAEGSAVITAISNSNPALSATCEITVSEPIPITGLEMKKTEDTVMVGDTVALEFTITPPDATYRNFTWSSSDESVATVDGGTVTALSVGEAVITVTSEKYPDISASTKVTVTPKKYTVILNYCDDVTENKTENVEDGKSITLETPTREGYEFAGWYLSADYSGEKLTGSYAPKENVTLYAKWIIPVDAVDLNRNSLSLIVGESNTVTATIRPDGTGESIEWSSDDEVVASVDGQGKITANAVGETTITATAGGKSASLTVSVYVNSLIDCGNEVGILQSVGDKGKIDSGLSGNLTYESDNEAVATVDSDGAITAVGAGRAKITIKSDDGSSAYWYVWVESLNNTELVSAINKLGLGWTVESDGTVMLTEENIDVMKTFTTVNLSGTTISSFNGIELFTIAKEFYGGITGNEADLSKNTNLYAIELSGSELKELVLGEFRNLHTFVCIGTQIESLDLSGYLNLKTLRCFDNKLTSLDLSGLTNLTALECGNQKNGAILTLTLDESLKTKWTETWSTQDYNKNVTLAN